MNDDASCLQTSFSMSLPQDFTAILFILTTYYSQPYCCEVGQHLGLPALAL